MVAHCIRTMLERLDTNARNQLFDIVIIWMKDKKVYFIYNLRIDYIEGMLATIHIRMFCLPVSCYKKNVQK